MSLEIPELVEGRVTVHPGGAHGPVCQECEVGFLTDKHNDALVFVQEATVLFLTEERVVKVGAAPVAYKARTGKKNGLIQDGPFKGWWAHLLGLTSESHVFFVARPNKNDSCGPTNTYPHNPVDDGEGWHKAYLALKGQFKKSAFFVSSYPTRTSPGL
jgi:hypothetical protein